MARSTALWRRFFLSTGMPTWLVMIACYGGLAALFYAHRSLPWWVVLPLGAWLVAWHGSLQHEAVHGHLARRRWANDLPALVPIGLFIPFAIYRESHLAHHACNHLTRPGVDPESFYVTPDRWARMPAPVRVALRLNDTVLGRLALGPGIEILRLVRSEGARVAAGERSRLVIWLLHGAAVAAFLGALWSLCGIRPDVYFLLFAYPGFSLVLLRSYLEHRPAAEPAHRTAIVEAGPVLSLLYLNNNLHVVHHDRPDLRWYEIPGAYRADRAGFQARNGGYVLGGYGALLRRYLWRTKGSPVHPIEDAV